MPGVRPLLVLGAATVCLFALIGGVAASKTRPAGTGDLLPVSVSEQSPAELREVEFHDAGGQRTFGDAAGDRLELTFDGVLDEHALGRDGDPQVVVSGEGGDDRTIQAGEHVDFRVEGDTLTVEVTGPGGDEIEDIPYRWVTIVDEVYDTNNNQVTVPDGGARSPSPAEGGGWSPSPAEGGGWSPSPVRAADWSPKPAATPLRRARAQAQ